MIDKDPGVIGEGEEMILMLWKKIRQHKASNTLVRIFFKENTNLALM